MKKYFSFIATALLALGFTACEDVPSPFSINDQDGGGSTSSLNYSSSNLNAGWTPIAVGTDQPWSQGNTYTQATGYQKWDGADAKTNRAVEGWLVSPSFNTTNCENVKFTFDHTIKYTNNVPNWEENHKIFATKNYSEDLSAVEWKEIAFTPEASPYSDWTLYSAGEFQLPEEFIGQESVRIGFWFKAPANASTTWELEHFSIQEGIAGETPQPTGSNFKFQKATTIESGKQYLIVSDNKAASAISGNYGYLKAFDAIDKDGYIVTTSLDNAFTFTATDNTYTSYTIQQANGKYLIQKDNYDSFNVEDSPTSGHIWLISAAYDRLQIMNEAVGKTIQFDPQYGSFGSYKDAKGSLPALYVLIGETDEEPYTAGGTDNPQPQPTGENLLTNGDFESWTGGLPDNWKSASTASNATLSQSTDAHGGSYAVSVATNATANKRLAYKEITLKAGTYTMAFYAKGKEVRPGYTDIDASGKANSSYTYGDYVSLSANEWTLVSHSFTLAAQTKLCLVVMNPKAGLDAIIDDFTLTTSDGGLVDDGTTEEPSDEPAQTAQFRKVEEITSGKQYLFVATDATGALKAALPIAATGNQYGYLKVADVTAENGIITADAANAFTIKLTDDGKYYTITQANGKQLYQTGTFNSFNVDATPTGGNQWIFTYTREDVWQITNVSVQKYIQYSTKYTSFGSYAEAQDGGVLPMLYEKVN